MDYTAEIQKLERWIKRATAALEHPELLTEYDNPDEIREGIKTRMDEIAHMRTQA